MRRRPPPSAWLVAMSALAAAAMAASIVFTTANKPRPASTTFAPQTHQIAAADARGGSDSANSDGRAAKPPIAAGQPPARSAAPSTAPAAEAAHADR